MPPTNDILTIEQSSANERIMYIGRKDRSFWKSRNIHWLSPTWSDYSGYLPNDAIISDIAAHPTNEDIVYIAQSNRIYKSILGGDIIYGSSIPAWTNISGSLPDIPINCILYDKSQPYESLYIGTDAGVFYKDGTMADWVQYNDGMPSAAIVYDLEMHYDWMSDNTLKAGTYGRGLWEAEAWPTSPVYAVADNTIAWPGEFIKFHPKYIGDPSDFYWYFGPYAQPITSEEECPQVMFYQPGVYDVKLMVKFKDHYETVKMYDFITVIDKNYQQWKSQQIQANIVESEHIRTGNLADNMKIYPNPTCDFVNISLDTKENIKGNVNIYNVSGTLVEKRENCDLSASPLRIDLSANEKGIYLLKIEMENEIVTGKISLVKE